MVKTMLQKEEIRREIIFTDEELQSLNTHIGDVPYEI